MKKLLFLILTIASLTANAATPLKIDEKKILKNIPQLNPQALKYAIKGYRSIEASGNIANPNILTIVDFTKPSNQKRLWVIDIKHSKLLLNTYTTHGKNSGMTMANSFSNNNSTEKSSIGLYKTLDAYKGKHGLSLRLQGLEKGINDHALARAIVVHPAWYATQSFINKYHRAGRSWGCFALAPSITKHFIDLTKDGSILFAYANQEKHAHTLG